MARLKELSWQFRYANVADPALAEVYKDSMYFKIYQRRDNYPKHGGNSRGKKCIPDEIGNCSVIHDIPTAVP
jgi:hypothetical protein